MDDQTKTAEVVAVKSKITPTSRISQGFPLRDLVAELPFHLSTFKILNFFLAGINPTDSAHSSKVVIIPVSVYADIVGVPYKSVSLDKLDAQLRDLLTIQFSYAERDQGGKPLGRGRLLRLNAFKCASVRQTEFYDGTVGQAIKIECTEEAIPLFFNLAECRYLKYRLIYVARLKMLTAYFLYLFLLQWNNTKKLQFPISLDELRNVLHCPRNEKYRTDKEFLRLLAKAAAEVSEKTDLLCSIKSVRSETDKRKVGSVQFSVAEKDKKTLSSGRPEPRLQNKSRLDNGGGFETVSMFDDIRVGRYCADEITDGEEFDSVRDETPVVSESNMELYQALSGFNFDILQMEAIIAAVRFRQNFADHNSVVDYLYAKAAYVKEKNPRNPYKYFLAVINKEEHNG